MNIKTLFMPLLILLTVTACAAPRPVAEVKVDKAMSKEALNEAYNEALRLGYLSGMTDMEKGELYFHRKEADATIPKDLSIKMELEKGSDPPALRLTGDNREAGAQYDAVRWDMEKILERIRKCCSPKQPQP